MCSHMFQVQVLQFPMFGINSFYTSFERKIARTWYLLMPLAHEACCGQVLDIKGGPPFFLGIDFYIVEIDSVGSQIDPWAPQIDP